jgi:hypothetical protein
MRQRGRQACTAAGRPYTVRIILRILTDDSSRDQREQSPKPPCVELEGLHSIASELGCLETKTFRQAERGNVTYAIR